MLGWARRINWGHWKRLKMLALALVAVGVFPVTAAAMLDGDIRDRSAPAIGENVAPAGVTPTNLARSYAPPFRGVAVPDGVQVQPTPGGNAAHNLRRSGPATVFVTDDGSRSIEGTQVALGFGLGLALASVAALTLMLSRGRMRAAHS